MAEGDLIVRMMSSGEAQVYDSVMKLATAWSKTEEATGKAGQEARKTAREEAALNKEVAAIRESLISNMQRYTRQVENLDNLLKRGKLTQDEHKRAVDQAKQSYEAAENAGKKAFGAEALGMITKYIGSIASIGTIVKTTTSYLNDMQAKSQEAAAKGSAAEGGLARLAMLAKSPEEYRALTDRARKVFGAGGAPSMEAASDLVFQMTSMGATGEDEAFFTRLGASQLVRSPAGVSMAAKSLQEGMGARETGSLKQIMAKAFAGQTQAPVSAEELLTAAAEPAAFAGMLKISDEELLSLIATASVRAGGRSGEEKSRRAGTQAKALLAALVKVTAGQSAEGGEEGGVTKSLEEAMGGGGEFDFAEGMGDKDGGAKSGRLSPKQIAFVKSLKGKPLAQMVSGIQSLGLDEATLMKLLGRKEATLAFDVVAKNRAAYESTLGVVRKGEAGTEMESSFAAVETDPSVLAAKMKRQMDARMELAAEQRGAMYNLAETLQGDFKLRMKKAGWGEGVRWSAAKADEWYQWMGSNESYIREAYKTANPERRRQIRSIMGWQGRNDFEPAKNLTEQAEQDAVGRQAKMPAWDAPIEMGPGYASTQPAPEPAAPKFAPTPQQDVTAGWGMSGPLAEGHAFGTPKAEGGKTETGWNTATENMKEAALDLKEATRNMRRGLTPNPSMTHPDVDK